MQKADPCCPKCKGTSGTQGEMTETHVMGGAWGEPMESGDSGDHVGKGIRWTLVVCLDCGAKFKHAALVRKGLA